MDNLSYIAFICLTVSLGLMLPLMEKKTRRIMSFMLVGIFSCLFISELNGILLRHFNNDLFYVTITITPVTEEIVKALPVLYYAIVFSDDRRELTSNAFAVGVGFAVLENMVILTQNIENVNILWALARGFGAGLVHGICTVSVGFGISYIKKRRKLFYCGTFSLMFTAIIYHAVFNTLVQSKYQYLGILLPIVTYVPVVLLMRSRMPKKNTAKTGKE